MDWNFLPKMARAKRQSDAEPAPTETRAAGRSPSAAPVALPDTADNLIFVARQPVMDHTEKVRGFELMIRAGANAVESAPANSEESAKLLLDTVNNFGVTTAIGDRLAFVATPPGVLESSVLDLLPKERFVLEYPASYLTSEKGPAHTSMLRSKGFTLALRCENDMIDTATLAKCADYVIYDLAKQPAQNVAYLDKSLRNSALKRIVRNVNARADFEAAKGFEFDLYQGQFFARAQTLANNRIDPMRERAIEILNLVMNRADITEIEDAFKHDVALCYSLLCYINSVGIGLQFKVASIRNAVMLLGYDFLWRWLSLLVYAGIDLSAAQRALLNTAIIRGRFSELLGQKALGEKGANIMFVTGAFSLLDVLLGIPLEQAIARINVPPEVADALLRHEGRLAPYLAIALAFEDNNYAQAKRLCDGIGITLDEASRTHLAAIEWAGILAK